MAANVRPAGAGPRECKREHAGAVTTGRNGATVVIKHGDKLEVLATNRADEQFDASPALAGKELFLRGHEYLYCIANSGRMSPTFVRR